MAFNINAHVVLSGPKNIKAIRSSIQKQLGSVQVSIQLNAPKNLTRQIAGVNKSVNTLRTNVNNLSTSAVQANTSLGTLAGKFNSLNAASGAMAKSQAKAGKQLGQTAGHVNRAGNAIAKFGKDAALALRRFAAFTVATTVVFGFVRAVGQAVKAGLQYEQTMTKIIQVTGAARNQIESVNSTIDKLSNSLGVDANELADVARTFAQTGQTIAQVESSIKAVARASLAPTFGDMKNTAEGLIAAMAQFKIQAKDQEQVLGALNAVSKKFAVESEDLISVIRRAGGVFAASGQGFKTPIEGLNQLIGVFTAVRSTTRESADTIAVGLRTIFTRIQRRGTIDFLKQFGIELVNMKGQFIGLFPAFQALSKGLKGVIANKDALQLSAITEELGGVRQVGKLIPAIVEFNKALRATKVAAKGAAEGLDQDVRLALLPLAKQFELVQRRFETLIRTITETPTFDLMARSALVLANALLRIGESLAPLIPLLTALAAIKIGKGVMALAGGFAGKVAASGGARAVGGNFGSFMTGSGRGFASGGLAKGTDTVPAMLTPGEFVIKRSSAQKIGYGNLNSMNRYAQGGVVATGNVQYLAGGTGMLGMPLVGYRPPPWSNLPQPRGGRLAQTKMPSLVGYRPQPSSMMPSPYGTGASSPVGLGKMAPGFGKQLIKGTTALQKFIPTLTRATKALVGFKGMVIGAIAEATLGGLANMAIGGMGFGKKQSIAGTDISGRAGVSTIGGVGGSEAGAVAVFDSIGPAVGSALAAAAMTAMIPGLAPLAPVVAAAVGAFQLAKGVFVGFAKQVEFNAFEKFRKSMDTSVEMLNRFNAASSVTDGGLRNLTAQVGFTAKRFDEIKKVSIERSQAENNFTAAGFFGREGVLASAAGGGAAGTAVGAGGAALAGAAGGAMLGASIGLIGGPLAPITSAFGATVGAVVGGIGGLVGALMTTDQNVKTTAQGFDRAAQSITPQFIEALNTAIAKTNQEVFKGIDEGILREIATTQTVDPSLDLANQAELTNSAFRSMSNALDNVDDATKKNIERLQDLNATSIKTGLTKAVEEEAKILGDKGPDFKAAFSNIQGSLNDAIDGVVKRGGNISDVTNIIKEDKTMTDASKEALIRHVHARFEDINAAQESAATMALVANAAAKTRKSIDALAAGLEGFSSATSSIAQRATILAGQVKSEFGQIFGKKSIGQLTNINPFENVANASDREIDRGVARFGPGNEDIAGMLKSTRDIPSMMKEVTEDLINRGTDVTNVQVTDAIRNRLGAAGVSTKVVNDMINQLQVSLGGRMGKGKGVGKEKLDQILTEMLTDKGGFGDLLGAQITEVTDKFKKATDNLNTWSNAVLDAARLSEEVAQKRLDTELAIAEKQKNIHERVNRALGKAPKSLARVTGDLGKKVRTLASGGTGAAVGGNVLDPRVLFSRLQGLQGRRKALNERLGLLPGQGAQAGAESPEFAQSAQELANLNAQINGTEKALEELANDTTRLAKLESLIADAKAKELASTGSIISVLDAISQVRTGKMDTKTFQEQVAAPMQAVENLFAGILPDFDTAVDLINRIQSGDQLIGGQLQRKATVQARLTGREGEEAQIIEEIFQGLLRAAGNTVMQNDRSGFGEFIGRQQNFSTFQRGRGRRAGAGMIGVGDQQAQILAETMARRDAQFRDEVLRPAHEGFMNAAVEFHAAVRDFRTMRGHAAGGVVGMAAGGNVFKPKGTDTVPAMLTPGEFVINRSSAKKIGYGNLGQLNNFSQGGLVGNTQYLKNGGKSKKKGFSMRTMLLWMSGFHADGTPLTRAERRKIQEEKARRAHDRGGGHPYTGRHQPSFYQSLLGLGGVASQIEEEGLFNFLGRKTLDMGRTMKKGVGWREREQGRLDWAMNTVQEERKARQKHLAHLKKMEKYNQDPKQFEGVRRDDIGMRRTTAEFLDRQEADWEKARNKRKPKTLEERVANLGLKIDTAPAVGDALIAHFEKQRDEDNRKAQAFRDRWAADEKKRKDRDAAAKAKRLEANQATRQERKESWEESKGRYRKTGSGAEILKRYGITLSRVPGGNWTPVTRADASNWLVYQRDPERYKENWKSDQAMHEKRRKEQEERARREKARQRSLDTRGPVINPLGDRWLDYQHLMMSKGGIVPRYQTGTDLVSRSGLAYLHRGEQVRPARSANGLSRTTTTQGDGNIFNEMQKGSALLTTELTSAFSVGASKMQPLVQALNSIPHEITLRAQLGAVTVNLAGGQILESLKNGIVAQMRKEIAEAIRSAINPVTGETVAPSISPFMGGPGEGRAGAMEAIA
jgi:TP901 family phage tail tape measure protein